MALVETLTDVSDEIRHNMAMLLKEIKRSSGEFNRNRVVGLARNVTNSIMKLEGLSEAWEVTQYVGAARGLVMVTVKYVCVKHNTPGNENVIYQLEQKFKQSMNIYREKLGTYDDMLVMLQQNEQQLFEGNSNNINNSNSNNNHNNNISSNNTNNDNNGYGYGENEVYDEMYSSEVYSEEDEETEYLDPSYFMEPPVHTIPSHTHNNATTNSHNDVTPTIYDDNNFAHKLGEEIDTLWEDSGLHPPPTTAPPSASASALLNQRKSATTPTNATARAHLKVWYEYLRNISIPDKAARHYSRLLSAELLSPDGMQGYEVSDLNMLGITKNSHAKAISIAVNSNNNSNPSTVSAHPTNSQHLRGSPSGSVSTNSHSPSHAQHNTPNPNHCTTPRNNTKQQKPPPHYRGSPSGSSSNVEPYYPTTHTNPKSHVPNQFDYENDYNYEDYDECEYDDYNNNNNTNRNNNINNNYDLPPTTLPPPLPTNIITQKNTHRTENPNNNTRLTVEYGNTLCITVSDPQMIGEAPNAWTEYKVFTNLKEYSGVVSPEMNHVVYRRFTNFESLYQRIKKWYPHKWLYKFPKKNALKRFQSDIVQSRMKKFNEMMKFICETPKLRILQWIVDWFDDEKMFAKGKHHMNTALYIPAKRKVDSDYSKITIGE